MSIGNDSGNTILSDVKSKDIAQIETTDKAIVIDISLEVKFYLAKLYC